LFSFSQHQTCLVNAYVITDWSQRVNCNFSHEFAHKYEINGSALSEPGFSELMHDNFEKGKRRFFNLWRYIYEYDINKFIIQNIHQIKRKILCKEFSHTFSYNNDFS
jgi:hypothetical protein